MDIPNSEEEAKEYPYGGDLLWKVRERTTLPVHNARINMEWEDFVYLDVTLVLTKQQFQELFK